MSYELVSHPASFPLPTRLKYFPRVSEHAALVRGGDTPHRSDTCLPQRQRQMLGAIAAVLVLGGCAAPRADVHQAILQKRVADSLKLIASGQDVDQRDQRGNTSLHYAAETNQIEIVSALIQRGADINARRFADGATPVLAGCVGGALEAVQLLRKSGAEFAGQACLYSAASWGRAYLVEAMLTEGIRPTASNNRKETALHVAIAKGHLDVVRVLLAGGSDIAAKTNEGRTPFEVAVRSGHREAAFLLLGAGAEPQGVCCGGSDAFASAIGSQLAAEYHEERANFVRAAEYYSTAIERFEGSAADLERESSRITDRQLSTLGGDFLLHLMAAIGKTSVVVERPSVVSMEENKQNISQLAQRARFMANDCKAKLAALNRN